MDTEGPDRILEMLRRIEHAIADRVLEAIEEAQLEEARERSLEDAPPPTKGTPASVLSRLETFDADSSGRVGSSEGCAICIGSFERGERVMALPCGHAFHEACVLPWVEKSVLCPTCRSDVSQDRA